MSDFKTVEQRKIEAEEMERKEKKRREAEEMERKRIAAEHRTMLKQWEVMDGERHRQDVERMERNREFLQREIALVSKVEAVMRKYWASQELPPPTVEVSDMLYSSIKRWEFHNEVAEEKPLKRQSFWLRFWNSEGKPRPKRPASNRPASLIITLDSMVGNGKLEPFLVIVEDETASSPALYDCEISLQTHTLAKVLSTRTGLRCERKDRAYRAYLEELELRRRREEESRKVYEPNYDLDDNGYISDGRSSLREINKR
jgi:hypothetical protein